MLVAIFRSVAALVLREMSTTYGRSRIGYGWVLLEPILAITFLAFAFSFVLRAPPVGESFVLFYATGYLPFLMYRDSAAKLGVSISFSRPLLRYPAVAIIDALIARLLLSILVGSVVFVVVMLGISLIEEPIVIADYFLVLISISLGFCVGGGVGVLNAFLFAVSQDWQRLWGVITRPLFLGSAVLYNFQALPEPIGKILWYNPLVHVVGLMRSGVYPSYDAEYTSIVYVIVICLVLSVFGLFMLRSWSDRLLN